ncbi:MAG: ABC transporter ATP-binding protein [Lachnospiraceae bacterium]|nr:ABC transporter ATP-binding protein [Lachnospiraceae bacterium]
MPPIVSLNDISMSYHSPDGETKAVSNVSFHVDEGEFVSIVGPSGCGKSTLLSIISGLIKPTTGEIKINSDKNVGYMLQKDYLFEWRTIFSNACLGLEIQNKLTDESRENTLNLINKYGLSEFKNSYPFELSGGMRQRAALIRTLATNPGILLLDEPFSALDYQTRLYISDEIGSIIRKEKKTAILVSHDISEAISLSDRVIVLSRRPGTVKSIYKIDLGMGEHTAMKAREAPLFREYFNKIWKELDVHV